MAVFSNIKKYYFECLVLIILILMYRIDFKNWYSEWIDFDSFYAFGLFVIGFLIYLFKKHFLVLKELPKKPSNYGFIFLFLGAITYLMGIRAEVYYLTSISLPLFIYGIILQFYGIEVFKKTFLPVALFSLTLPIFPLHRITSPLMMLATKVSSKVFIMLGIPSFTEGNILNIMNKKLTVAAGCSGLKSLFSLFFLSIIYSYFTDTRLRNKIAVVLASLFLAFSMNIIRITIVGFYVLYNGYKHSNEFHDMAGIALLAVSFGVIVLIFRSLENNEEYQ